MPLRKHCLFHDAPRSTFTRFGNDVTIFLVTYLLFVFLPIFLRLRYYLWTVLYRIWEKCVFSRDCLHKVTFFVVLRGIYFVCKK